MIAALALFIFAPAQAAPPQPSPPPKAQPREGEISYSYYLISCGSYIEHRQAGAENNYNNTADTFYVAGWLSAYNRMKPTSGIPDDTTLDDIMLWLEQYCRKNPLGNLEDGLFALADEMKPRHEEAPQGTPQPSPLPQQARPAMQFPLAPKQPSVPGLKPLNY